MFNRMAGRLSVLLVLSLILTGLISASTIVRAQPEIDWPEVTVVQRWTGFSRPLAVTSALDGTGRLFVTEQEGRVSVIENGQVLPQPFLDIRGAVTCCGEQGLLSLAFPPGFTEKQYFYVNYIDRSYNTVVSRFWISPQDPNRADPSSEQVVLHVVQPGAVHNGGHLAFGPDGYLYIALGEGRFSQPPNVNMAAQDPSLLFGKILRIDTELVVRPPRLVVERNTSSSSVAYEVYLPAIETGRLPPYLIPPTNPFVNHPGYREEIWALGLRNPWQFSFDRQEGDLYVGDVGQERYEEIDFQAAGASGGENYGWPVLEGDRCFASPTCDPQGFTPPVTVYEHVSGGRCAVISGNVYRGQAFAALHGIYLYGDFCTGEIWGMQQVGGAWQSHLLGDAPFVLTSFGEDEAGNLFVTDYSNGGLYQIMPVAE